VEKLLPATIAHQLLLRIPQTEELKNLAAQCFWLVLAGFPSPYGYGFGFGS
jgi:hypothetical protein